jgi:hypothetical protein
LATGSNKKRKSSSEVIVLINIDLEMSVGATSLHTESRSA